MQEQLLVFARLTVSLIRGRVVFLPDAPPVILISKKTSLNKTIKRYIIEIAKDMTATKPLSH
ncbi:MAG: hypothetical protein ACL7AY_16050 [Candidatus Arsenophonus phytopathogenicus]